MKEESFKSIDEDLRNLAIDPDVLEKELAAELLGDPLDDIDLEAFNSDLSILQEFINTNNSITNLTPLELGVQKWKNMRLDFLYLGMHDLTVVPEDICNIYTNLSGLNISGNSICPPYPNCIQNIIGDQDITNCNR